MGYIILCEDPQNRVKGLWRTKSKDYGHVYDDALECNNAIDLLNNSTISMEVNDDLVYSMGVYNATD